LKLTSLKITNFKNYPFEEVRFSPHLNYLVGSNGMGKTNILDAIYFLCQGKSYFQSSDKQLILHNQDFLRVEGQFSISDKNTQVVIKLPAGKKKEIQKNKQPYRKLSDFVGELPVVLIAPDDTLLIREGSESRRKFIDSTLSQFNRTYLEALLKYNALLKQRNQLLKTAADKGGPDYALLQIYAEQMSAPAEYIFRQRKIFLETLLPVFQQIYEAISGGVERVNMLYQSDLLERNFLEGTNASLQKDSILQRCCFGIHRDDFLLELEQHPVKQFGSQGQVKSFLIALKLAQYLFIKNEKQIKPILLLDDIFDKLDPIRVDKLLQYMLENDFGQVFLTDTHEERMQQIIHRLGGTHHAFRVSNGTLNQFE
jgi:DNA replication and repair protein RecF